jgi:hypothetical protein
LKSSRRQHSALLLLLLLLLLSWQVSTYRRGAGNDCEWPRGMNCKA